MNRELIQLVWDRAENRCEYCRFPSSDSWLPFQIDHIISHKHGGPTDSANLALTCYYCNSFKGPNIAGIDPEGQPDVAVQLFHPRQDDWRVHFEWNGPVLNGNTPKGRSTIVVLRINDSEAVEVRRLLLEGGQTL